MISLALGTLLSLAAPPAEGATDQPRVGRVAAQLLQVTVRQIIIRVPRRDQRVPAISDVGWSESNGPRCIPARQITAAMPSPRSVDLLMRDNRRIRAQLAGRCVALNYYRGLYVDANADGQLCAGRDAIRSRMGAQCEIVAFRALRPLARNR